MRRGRLPARKACGRVITALDFSDRAPDHASDPRDRAHWRAGPYTQGECSHQRVE
jgi:hypothetical protein